MRISIIGMSNAGKTYWSKKLELIGFRRFSCDDIIGKELEGELKRLGHSGIDENNVAKWLGQPYESQYPQTSKKYLDLETTALNRIIRQIADCPGKEAGIVIDTTGSIIYTDAKIIKQLSEFTTIVYLETPRSVQKEMCNLYFKNPKAVIWGSSFKRLNGESYHEALKQCYPQLLDYRAKQYKKYAHITLDYFLLRQPNFNTEDFINLVCWERSYKVER